MSRAEARGDGGAWIFIFKMQLDQRRETEAQAVADKSSGKVARRTLIEQKAGFKVGTGGRVLDRAYAIAQVELLRALFDWAEQPLQAAAQIRGLADVGLGLRIARRAAETPPARPERRRRLRHRVQAANSRRSVSTRSF